MANKPESPTEPFKRALAHAARSLAELPDLEVVFSGDGPSLVGHRAVLPHPPRDLNAKEAARIRGLADQMALRLSHHDAAAHARLRPHSPQGSAVFEAVEQARVEAIGANALGGVRANLTAVLEANIERKGLDRLEDRSTAPIADVLAMLVRERLTGDAPRPSTTRPPSPASPAPSCTISTSARTSPTPARTPRRTTARTSPSRPRATTKTARARARRRRAPRARTSRPRKATATPAKSR